MVRMNSSLVGYSIGFGIGGFFNPNFSIVSVIMVTLALILGLIWEYRERKVNKQK